MAYHETEDRIDLIILARVGGYSGKRSLGISDARRSVMRYTDRTLSEADRARLVDDRIAALIASGLLTEKPFQLSVEGEQRLCRQLGVDRPPPWRRTKESILPVLALGHSPATEAGRRIRTADNFRGAVLDSLFELGMRNPTTAGAISALAARQLNDPRAARVSGLKEALVARWTNGGPVQHSDQPEEAQAAEQGPVVVDDVLAIVRSALRDRTVDRFVGRNVYTSAIFDFARRQDARFEDMVFDDFGRMLVELNKRRLIRMVRADYISAMDRDLVDRSRITDLGGDLHFVIDESVE